MKKDENGFIKKIVEYKDANEEEGKEFKAKPIGSRELKQQYRKDLDSLIGKMATVKFFYFSDEGTPLQPVLKCIRDYE